MEIIKKGKMIDGTKIQIENWNNSYPNTFEKNSTIACYPVAKNSIPARWCNVYPERGKSFRYELQFKNEEEAEKNYNKLLVGEKKLIDYINNYSGSINKEDLRMCL